MGVGLGHSHIAAQTLPLDQRGPNFLEKQSIDRKEMLDMIWVDRERGRGAGEGGRDMLVFRHRNIPDDSKQF